MGDTMIYDTKPLAVSVIRRVMQHMHTNIVALPLGSELLDAVFDPAENRVVVYFLAPVVSYAQAVLANKTGLMEFYLAADNMSFAWPENGARHIKSVVSDSGVGYHLFQISQGS